MSNYYWIDDNDIFFLSEERVKVLVLFFIYQSNRSQNNFHNNAICKESRINFFQYWDIGRIHLVLLRIHKYLTDDSFVNFRDKFWLHFLLKFRKKWRKNLLWKFTDESSIKYLQICKWTRWIRPKTVLFKRIVQASGIYWLLTELNIKMSKKHSQSLATYLTV